MMRERDSEPVISSPAELRASKVKQRGLAAVDSDATPREFVPAMTSMHALLHLQRHVGNHTVQRMLATDRPASSPGSVEQLRLPADAGQPISAGLRSWFEGAFDSELDSVRIHTSPAADTLSNALNAKAFTTGRDIFFRRGMFRPHSLAGQELLTHELTHVIQQQRSPAPQRLTLGAPDDRHEREASQVASRMTRSLPSRHEGSLATNITQRVPTNRIQRDLAAYNKEKLEVLPSMGMEASASMITTSAEAPGIRIALAKLIADGKVSEVVSKSGNMSWFSANHHKNAQLADITKAFTDASYPMADKMARALYDIHGEYLYSNQKLSTTSLFYTHTADLGTKVTGVRNRSMTEWEIRQARRVFKGAIDYTQVTIADGSISAKVVSAGGYARTVGNTIHFPTGSSRDMAFMVHELTHVWQYQKTGWKYAPKALWAQATEGYGYTPKGKTPDEALNDARAAGKTLFDFNNEQQGDILADFFRRLQKGSDVSAYQPFVGDVK